MQKTRFILFSGLLMLTELAMAHGAHSIGDATPLLFGEHLLVHGGQAMLLLLAVLLGGRAAFRVLKHVFQQRRR